jgi:hypothetical protein
MRHKDKDVFGYTKKYFKKLSTLIEIMLHDPDEPCETDVGVLLV